MFGRGASGEEENSQSMWPQVAAAAASSAGDMLSTFAGGNTAYKRQQGLMREQQRWAEAQAQKQMEFQERMSSTAHQREAADLEKAGLNRILALGDGASSPAGASGGAGGAPYVENPVQPFIGKMASSAMDMKRLAQDVKESNIRIGIGEQEKKKKAMDAEQSRLAADRMAMENDILKYEADYTARHPFWAGILSAIKRRGVLGFSALGNPDPESEKIIDDAVKKISKDEGNPGGLDFDRAVKSKEYKDWLKSIGDKEEKKYGKN